MRRELQADLFKTDFFVSLAACAEICGSRAERARRRSARTSALAWLDSIEAEVVAQAAVDGVLEGEFEDGAGGIRRYASEKRILPLGG